MHRSKNCKHSKKRKNQRAAKGRKFVERVQFEQTDEHADALNAEAQAWLANNPFTKAKRSGFRITIECLDDGEKASFTTSRALHGLTISATDCGRRVASVLLNYQPLAHSGMRRDKL